MESFITDDGSVAKFIHDDGSETAVKVVKSCSNFREDDGRVRTEWVDRNKYSVFISASLGCYMKCPLCTHFPKQELRVPRSVRRRIPVVPVPSPEHTPVRIARNGTTG